MLRDRLDDLTRDWPGVSTDIKWGDDLVYSVAGKMFAVYCLAGPSAGRVSFKAGQERFLELTDQPEFIPAPYLARAHWVTLEDPSRLEPEALAGFVRRSYEQVRARLTKKLQRELSD